MSPSIGVTYNNVNKDMAPAFQSWKWEILKTLYLLPSDINGSGPGTKSSSGINAGRMPITSVVSLEFIYEQIKIKRGKYLIK